MNSSSLNREEKIPVVCFAPPITDEILEEYGKRIYELPDGPIKDAILECYQCVVAWWTLPESTLKPKQQWKTAGGKSFHVIPLEDSHIKSLHEVTPWDYECDAMDHLFSTLPTGIHSEQVASAGSKGCNIIGSHSDAVIRDMAFHLLWYTKEITRDREPISMDKLS